MLHDKKQTIPTEIRDFPEWRRGRKEYTLWMIALDHDEIIRMVESARNHLSQFLVPTYRRQPHITLSLCGFFAEDRRYPDDYTRSEFDVHRRLLTDSGIRPFFIEIGGMNSFASAPFFEVRDTEGGIERVKQLLPRVSNDIVTDRFTPHVTVGLYAGVFESGVVLERLSAFKHEPLKLRIDRIMFAAYDAREMCGPLVYREQVELCTAS